MNILYRTSSVLYTQNMPYIIIAFTHTYNTLLSNRNWYGARSRLFSWRPFKNFKNKLYYPVLKTVADLIQILDLFHFI